MSSSVITPPIVPMRLIMAFALLRMGLGVTSGISATAGERYRHMNTSVNAVAASISASERELCAKLTSMNVQAASTEPHTINGMRRPTLLRSFIGNLSDHIPINGSKTTAKMLSSAMIAPRAVALKSKSFRNSGIRLSYTCQNMQTVKNASPTSMVRGIFSFSP